MTQITRAYNEVKVVWYEEGVKHALRIDAEHYDSLTGPVGTVIKKVAPVPEGLQAYRFNLDDFELGLDD